MVSESVCKALRASDLVVVYRQTFFSKHYRCIDMIPFLQFPVSVNYV